MRFLIVDDECGWGFLLGRALHRLGHDALLARRVDDALEMLDANLHGVITDLDLENEDGLALAEIIRQQRPDLPVAVLLPILARPDRVAEAEALGPVLSKVWTTDELVDLVELLRVKWLASHARPRTHARAAVARAA